MKKRFSWILAASLVVPFAQIGHAAESLAFNYEQAIEKALNNPANYTLKNADANIDRSFEQLQKAGENVKYIPGGPGNPAANQVFTGYTQAGLNYEINKKDKEKNEEALKVATIQSYNAVLQAEEKKKLANLKVENAYMQNMMSKYKEQAGLSGKIEADRVEKTYDAERKTLQAEETSLKNAYESFNKLVGLKPDERPVLTEKLVFERLPETDVEGHIAAVISESPDIWKAEKAIDIARLNLDLYTFNDPTNPDSYGAKKIDVEKAQNTSADAKKQTADKLRELYNTIRQIEESYSALETQIASAEEGLRLMEIQYNAGVLAKAELMATKVQVEELKSKKLDLAVNHSNLVQTFNKPWAAIQN